MHLTPGSPLDPQAPNANPLTKAAQENLLAKYGLTKPLHEQYLIYLWNVSHLDFGISYMLKDRDVSTILAGTFPISLMLGLLALIFASTLGLFLGIVPAMRQNTWIDYLATSVSMLSVSTP